MMPHDICIVCHDKRFHSQLDKINQLEQLIRLQKIDIDRHKRYASFTWFINKKCQFGMPCQTLQSKNREALAKASMLEPYLNEIAESDNITLYHNVLNILRGNFPSVYRHMEELHQGYIHRK